MSASPLGDPDKEERDTQAVEVGHAQGTQIGPHGMQVNYFTGRDKQVLGVRNSYIEADQLAVMPHDEAVDLVARSEVAAAARVLAILLSPDRDRVISLLVTIERSKAEALVAAIGSSEADGLEDLPAAAEAMAACAARARHDLGDIAGQAACAAQSRQGTPGFYRRYKRGWVHWSARGGAHATTGQAGEYYVSGGGSGGHLGFPLSAARAAGQSPFKTDGTWQLFEWSSDYPPNICERMKMRCGATLYWSEKHGAHVTWGGIGEYYESADGTWGWLGFPVTDAIEVSGPARRPNGNRSAGWCQRFEGGTVFYTEKAGAIALTSAIAEYHASLGDVGGRLGFPVSPAMDAADSPYETKGKFHRFEGNEDYPSDIVDHWSDQEHVGGATVYWSEPFGTHAVTSGIGKLYERQNGTYSWLGFPTSERTDARTSSDQPWCCYQDFEGGTIFWKEEYRAIAVRKDIMEVLSQDHGLRWQLGFPVIPESVLESSADVRTQIFEHGVVTVRNGTVEAWVRPGT
jgi:LGFP repeat